MPKKLKKQNDFNIFVAGKTGAFKGVRIDNKGIIVKNLQNVELLKPDSEISLLNWGDKNESEILIGTVNQIVKVYDTEFKAYSTSFEAKFGTGPIVGITRLNGSITTCSGSGHIKVWKYKKSEELELKTGEEVSKMRRHYKNEAVVGLGGKKNDLKLWDLETSKKIFSAKNVKKDMLELEVPVWITDLAFVPDSEYKIAVSTRYGQIRLYDTKAQRRPVIDINLEDQALNTISLCCNSHQVVVGSTRGHLMAADLRGKGKILHHYKGPVGSVRQVVAHRTLPYFVSVGLDRYLRVHQIETRRLSYEQYLKVRLNCALITSNFGQDLDDSYSEEYESDEDNIECIDLESNNELNDSFNKIKNVDGEPKKKKLKKQS